MECHFEIGFVKSQVMHGLFASGVWFTENGLGGTLGGAYVFLKSDDGGSGSLAPLSLCLHVIEYRMI